MIYSEPCKVCGERESMHLGDFDTDQFEIMIVCDKCIKKLTLELLAKRLGYRAVLWKFDKGKIMTLVVALTDNAWEHRDMNHPNEGDVKKVKEYAKA